MYASVPRTVPSRVYLVAAVAGGTPVAVARRESSGAPSVRGSTSFARPKSSTLTRPEVVTITFAGFTSRWTMPAAWAAASASAASAAYRSASSTGRPPWRDPAVERLAVDLFHRDEVEAVRRADVVDRDDVRVVQRGSRLRLPDEATSAFRVRDRSRRKELDGDGAIEPRVNGAIDDAHPAFAELVDDPIVRDCPADHGRNTIPELRPRDSLRRTLRLRFRLGLANPAREVRVDDRHDDQRQERREEHPADDRDAERLARSRRPRRGRARSAGRRRSSRARS